MNGTINGDSELQLNPLSAAARLRKMLASEEILVLPGVVSPNPQPPPPPD